MMFRDSSLIFLRRRQAFVPLYEGQALADRIIAFLEQRAFRLTGVFNVSEDHRTGLALQADFLFAKDK